MMNSHIENWILKRCAISDFKELEQWQKEAWLKQKEWAKKSSFYSSLKEFTSPQDLQKDPFSFLCVNPKEVSRITTLPTSGTGGNPKRIFFTERDLELTVEYFSVGMQELMNPGEKAAIFMPGATLGSVGDSLVKAVNRFFAQAQSFGFIKDLELSAKEAEGAHCILGHPIQLLSLSRQAPHLRPKSILLTGDPVENWLLKELEETWGCRSHPHYGSTEAGFGCAVRGKDGVGQQICHPFLFLEVIDPKTGIVLPDGEWGEVVLSTLQREAMPFLRYRTGDWGRFLPGFQVKRLDLKIKRLRQEYFEANATIHHLDALVFSLKEVLTYRASLDNQGLLLEIDTSLSEQNLNKRLKEIWTFQTPWRIEIKPLDLEAGKRKVSINF